MSIVQQDAPFPTITKQEVMRKYDDQGNDKKHWRVHLRHHDGTVSYIDLPDEEYTADNIRVIAQDEANRVHEVFRLTPAEHRQERPRPQA